MTEYCKLPEPWIRIGPAEDRPTEPPDKLAIYFEVVGSLVRPYGVTDAMEWALMLASSTGSGVVDHGALTGLTDDDHSLYPPISSQAGIPTSVPARIGAVNVDTANGKYYGATAATASADWTQLSNDDLIEESNVLYVGKHGSDTNDGKNISEAFLTFGAAITVAAASASSVNQFVIICLDGGTYAETLTCVDYVHIDAPGATIKSNGVTGATCFTRFKSVSAGIATTQAPINLASADGWTVKVASVSCENAAYGAVAVNNATAELRLFVGEVSHSASGACFDVDDGTVYAICNNVASAGAAYNVANSATAKLYLQTASLSGTRTLGAAGTVRVVSPEYATIDYLKLSDSATQPPLNVTERSAAPSSPVTNDVYLDDGTNTASGNPGWRRYTGAVWEDITAAAGGGGSAAMPQGYINGFEVNIASTTIAITPGVARDDSDSVELERTTSAGNLTIDPTGTGAGGIDANDSALAASTWYRVYVIAEADGANIAGFMSTSATPTLPGSYTVKRRIGWALTDGSSVMYYQNTSPGDGTSRQVMWNDDTTASPFLIWSNKNLSTYGTWDTATFTGVIPATARKGVFSLGSVTGGSGGTIFWRERANDKHYVAGVNPGTHVRGVTILPITASQTLQFSGVGATDEDFCLSVQGYIDNLNPSIV